MRGPTAGGVTPATSLYVTCRSRLRYDSHFIEEKTRLWGHVTRLSHSVSKRLNQSCRASPARQVGGPITWMSSFQSPGTWRRETLGAPQASGDFLDAVLCTGAMEADSSLLGCVFVPTLIEHPAHTRHQLLLRVLGCGRGHNRQQPIFVGLVREWGRWAVSRNTSKCKR